MKNLLLRMCLAHKIFHLVIWYRGLYWFNFLAGYEKCFSISLFLAGHHPCSFWLNSIFVYAGLNTQSHYQNHIIRSSNNNHDCRGYGGDSRLGEKAKILNRPHSSVGFSLCGDCFHSNEEEN